MTTSTEAASLPDIGADELPYEGTIRVTQATTPAGAAQRFDYTADFAPGSFTLGDGESHNPGPLAVGVYSVAVTPVEGWTATAVCNDGSPVEAIDLSPGETVTCTFTHKQAGHIVVKAQTVPAEASQLFDFTTNYDPYGFTLGHGQSLSLIHI